MGERITLVPEREGVNIATLDQIGEMDPELAGGVAELYLAVLRQQLIGRVDFAVRRHFRQELDEQDIGFMVEYAERKGDEQQTMAVVGYETRWQENLQQETDVRPDTVKIRHTPNMTFNDSMPMFYFSGGVYLTAPANSEGGCVLLFEAASYATGQKDLAELFRYTKHFSAISTVMKAAVKLSGRQVCDDSLMAKVLDSFTPDQMARRMMHTDVPVLGDDNETAYRLNSAVIVTEHILGLALADSSGYAANVVEDLGWSVADTRTSVGRDGDMVLLLKGYK